MALDSRPGRAGGVDVYTRSLVEAIGDLASPGEIEAVVFTWQELYSDWLWRRWPAHVSFRVLRRSAHPLRPTVRLARAVGRRLGIALQPTEGDHFLARQVDEMGLDVVHFPRTLMYPRSVRTSSVLTMFDIQQEYYPQFFTRKELEERRRAYRQSAESAVHLIAPSEFTKESLCEKFGVSAERVSVVPAGIGTEFRRQSASSVAAIRSRHRLPERFFLYPANPWPHKNHSRLMAALRLLGESRTERLALVLTGRLEDEVRDYESLAIAAGVEDQVTDLGFVGAEDLPALYSAASFMVFPSLFEGFGIPLVEAMACGCPIAASRATSIPEIVDGAALLFDPMDVPALAAAIGALWNRPDLRADLAACGRVVAARFSWETVLPRLLAVYREVSTELQPLAPNSGGRSEHPRGDCEGPR